MGHKANATGFRLGVGLGWDSSWSSHPDKKGQDYRYHLHMDLEIRTIITQLFAARNGYVGKIGFSKNPKTGITDISVFGYVPGRAIKFRFAPPRYMRATKARKGPVLEPQHIRIQLKRLVEVLNEKYSPEVFTLRCALVQGVVTKKGKVFIDYPPRSRHGSRSKGRFRGNFRGRLKPNPYHIKSGLTYGKGYPKNKRSTGKPKKLRHDQYELKNVVYAKGYPKNKRSIGQSKKLVQKPSRTPRKPDQKPFSTLRNLDQKSSITPKKLDQKPSRTLKKLRPDQYELKYGKSYPKNKGSIGKPKKLSQNSIGNSRNLDQKPSRTLKKLPPKPTRILKKIDRKFTGTLKKLAQKPTGTLKKLHRKTTGTTGTIRRLVKKPPLVRNSLFVLKAPVRKLQKQTRKLLAQKLLKRKRLSRKGEFLKKRGNLLKKRGTSVVIVKRKGTSVVSKRVKERSLLRNMLTLKRRIQNKKAKNNSWKPNMNPEVALGVLIGEFKRLSKAKYFDSLMNVSYLTFKAREPQLLATLIARELGRPALAKTRRQRIFCYQTADVCAFLFKRMPVSGIRIEISGRLNKRKRSTKWSSQHGIIPSSTMIQSVRYGFGESYSVFGSMGVKVWLAYE